MVQIKNSLLAHGDEERLIQKKIKEGYDRVSASKLVKKELQIIEKNSQSQNFYEKNGVYPRGELP